MIGMVTCHETMCYAGKSGKVSIEACHKSTSQQKCSVLNSKFTLHFLRNMDICTLYLLPDGSIGPLPVL